MARFLYVKAILKAKTATQAGLASQSEAYCDADLYAFYRAKMFVAITSKFYTVSRNIITHPFSNGDVICNIFYPTTDCLTVSNGSFQIVLLSGEAKVFIPKSMIKHEEKVEVEEEVIVVVEE
jgi:alpha-amylase